jgi:hypothetical protein
MQNAKTLSFLQQPEFMAIKTIAFKLIEKIPQAHMDNLKLVWKCLWLH